jgi:hypothetical protein
MEQRLVRPERHSAPALPAVVPYVGWVVCPRGRLAAGPEALIEAGESPAAWSALAFVLCPRAAPPQALVETGELPAKGWSMAQAFASRLPEALLKALAEAAELPAKGWSMAQAFAWRLPEARLKALAEAAEQLPAEWAPKAIAW